MHQLTRRDAIAQLALAAASCSLQRTEEPRGTQSPWKFAIGLNGFGSSETHHGTSYTLTEILKFAQAEGFQGIELWRGWRDGYPDPNDAAAVLSTREEIESFGLQIFSIQAGVPGINPLSGDAAERDRYTSGLLEQLGLARKLGCDAMGLWLAGRDPQGTSDEQIIARLADVLRPVVQQAADSGIVLAIEGEPPLIVNSVARYHMLFDAAGMDNLKVIFDPSHFDLLNGAEGRPEDLLLELGVGRVGYVQFCDGDSTLRPFPSGRGGTSRHLPCGEGLYNLPKLCSLLYEGGFRGWFQMDSWGTEDAYWTSRSCMDTVGGFLLNRSDSLI